MDLGREGVRMTVTSTTFGYSGPTVCRLTGVTYRQLDYWARTELITPSITPASGSGSKRSYSYGDVLQVKVIKSLLDSGVSLARARQAVECLRDSLGEDLAASSLVLSDSGSVLAASDGDLVDLLRGGQGVFNIIPLANVVAELRTMMSQTELTKSEKGAATA
jgi:DNA-binding transcriptional MerR regulator